ncbi:hypothetical protein DNTS_008319 [Danionella cerebrum]|uniref:Methyltransferase-like protein 23 n=1 Tax=Danionella cerebrum TaxID=2873325 RepID=A0A553R2E0_9TELE|nr:hypothetical protein DNTS_008319 [Danionella translucida]
MAHSNECLNESFQTLVEKSFIFEDVGNSHSLTVTVSEVLDPQYGMYVWPCAVVLAQYVWSARGQLQHKTVLELGAGVSLPGVVASKCGAGRVILSDSAERPLCQRNCSRSCDLNGITDITVLPITWGRASPELLWLPPVDIVLGSDVFYEPEDFEDVLVTFSFILKKNPHAQFWTTYQERSSDWSIEGLLQKWNLKSINIPLETFEANTDCLAGSTLPGNHTVQMMIITNNCL